MTDDFDNVKDPDDDREFGVDFHDELVVRALPRTSYALNTVLYFGEDSGFYYQVTTAGRTSAGYPRDLPRTSGQTVDYGSAVLTCVHPSAAALASISGALWIMPAGLTKSAQRTDGFVAFATFSGGADGADYDVTCRMTPSVGNAIDKTITILVRSE